MDNKRKKAITFLKDEFWIIILDMIAVNVAYWLALNARFIGYAELGELFHSYQNTLFAFALFYALICVAVFASFRLYNGMWRFTGMHDLNRVLFASGISNVLHALGTIIFFQQMPLTYYALGAVFQFILVSVIRLGTRVFSMEKAKLIRHMSPAENVMIIRSNWNVRNLMIFLENDQEKNLKPVCIIDDSKHKQIGS